MFWLLCEFQFCVNSNVDLDGNHRWFAYINIKKLDKNKTDYKFVVNKYKYEIKWQTVNTMHFIEELLKLWIVFFLFFREMIENYD